MNILLLLLCVCLCECKYAPTWSSLDARPLPSWYDDSKVGIFLHWGVFSVPSFHSEWFWNAWKQNSSDVVKFMKNNYPPGFTYADFAKDFTAEFYDPDHWADIFNASGAKYIVLTSKHHEGYTLWPSKYSFNWNAGDVGPHRDLLGDLAKAIRAKTDIKFGLYHSMYEWYNPLYLYDKKNKFNTQKFVFGKTMPELYELVNTYKPEVIWSDGDWEAKDRYWNSTDFLAWLYNESPVRDTVVVNDRWGSGTPCHHGGYYTCTDRYNPGVLQKHKWENCMTVDKHSWGYRRNAQLSDYLTTYDLIKQLVTTVSCGGNILINVGPTHDGRIIPIFEERLRSLGAWLGVNGAAIYSSKPWSYQNDTLTPGVWYTAGGSTVYAITLSWPDAGVLKLGAPKLDKAAEVKLLGSEDKLKWTAVASGVVVKLPLRSHVKSQHAWTLAIKGVTN